MKWIALFSQTGSEIYEVSKRLGRFPDHVITNKQDWDGINKDLVDHTIICYTDNKPDVAQYNLHLREDAIITLNGWLRIVPEEVCEKYEIYNGHPGLITKWPELKGKDPQKKAFYSRHETAGCVIHEVVPEVDAGKILLEDSIEIKGLPLDEVYSKLHKVSVDLWVEFLKERLEL
jgi:folate-dependent phosphoribosylglycinamide formyltransferase PurN